MSAPLVAAHVDLRDFAYMPLDVLRLRDSDLSAEATDAEFRAAVMLWCAAWHQVPAASLPDNDAILTRLAGLGRDIGAWCAVKEGALRSWVKCDDGRIYHPVVAEKANEAWLHKEKQRDRTAAARAARAANSDNPSPPSGTKIVPCSVTETVTGSKGTERNGTEVREDQDATASSLPSGNATSATIVPIEKARAAKRERKAESDQSLLDRITDIWNAWASSRGSPQVRYLTGSRAIHCRRRIAELTESEHAKSPEEAFRALISKCEESFFIRGSPRKPLAFKQLMSEDFMARMMEGEFKYSGGKTWRK